METSGKKTSASKQKVSGTVSRKKSKSTEKKTQKIKTEEEYEQDAEGKKIKDIKDRARILPHIVENVGLEFDTIYLL